MDDRYRMNSFDVALIIFLALSSAGYYLLTRSGANQKASKVTVCNEGKPILNILLNEDREVELLGGRMRIKTENRRVRVVESDCPRKICVERGWIHASGQIIVCVPNQIAIEIRAEDTNFLDAVVE